MGLGSGIKKIFAEPSDPRKLERGSNLDSKGSTPTDAAAMKESGSSKPLRLPDIVPQFSNRAQQLRAFKEMEDGDTTVDVSMRAVKTPIMGATFFMQPFDDTPMSKDIAEFCRFNIFEGTARPFIMILDDVLRMFNDGWSVLEQVFETREWAPRRSGANRKNYTMLKKLAARPALTIKDIVYDDNGGPVSIIQNAIRADGRIDEVDIKVEKLLLFTFGGIGGDLMGKSLLRTAYQPWYFKKELYKIDAIGHERNHLGIPVWSLNEGFTQADVDAAWSMVTQMRTNEKSGVVEPPNNTFRFEKPQGQPSDIMPSIEHHDAHILLNVLGQFLMLGLTGGGGRATSGAHVDMFQKSVRYFADYICGVFNLYCVPKLVGYNFDTDQFPKMRVRNIGETKDLQMWASSHARMVHEGAITVDEETENYYRENMDMPYLLGARPAPIVKEATAKSNGKGGVSNAGTTGDTSVPSGFDSTGG
jgi:hypothetical protein